LKRYLFLLSLLFSSLIGFSQQLELDYKERPLNEVLLDLRDRYKLQCSFDDEKLAHYPITVKQTFRDMPEAIQFLLKDLPLSYEQAGEVFLIYSRVIVAEPKVFLVSALVEDRNSGESLPFAHVLINDRGMATDQDGAFAFRSVGDSLFQVRVSYLGYYPLDTVVGAGTHQVLRLTPSLVRLKEIQVEGLRVVRSQQIGQEAGVIRLNQQVAGSLPGYGDNSVFNLLRLQPGILAAGEQSADLIIRGSYEGQSQVLFDGFTLFGMKNFNDNISAVNPFMAKDIRVMKGGFPAEYGERVGGIVEITGLDGSADQFQLQLSANNMTMNGWLNVPVSKNSSLVMAMRQTYYELYDKNQLDLGTRSVSGRRVNVDRYVYPDYNFRDLNLKYSAKTEQGDFFSLSVFRGQDRYSSSLSVETRNKASLVAYDDKERNLQYGASARYSKSWKNGGRTELTAAFSSLQSTVENLRQSAGQQGGNGQGNGGPGSGATLLTRVDDYNKNRIGEFRTELQNHLAVGSTHNVGFGAGITLNDIYFREDTFNVNVAEENYESARLNIYAEDHISLAANFQFTAGLRADWAADLERFDVQPRLSLGYEPVKPLKFTASWGTYRQYISRASVLDEWGNYRYLWTVCNDDDIPVLWSQQATLGFAINHNDFTFSVEAYKKHTTGLTRYVRSRLGDGVFEGDAKAKGIDFLVKQDWKGHSFWVAYTLSETLEHFSYFRPGVYRRALHDQRHELKAAALLNFKPFCFSANYVYGSGFPSLIDDPLAEGLPYNRVDAAVSYRLIREHYSLEAGISVLNVLNYENVKYDNFVRIPSDQDATVNISAEAVPFTPTMFLKVAF